MGNGCCMNFLDRLKRFFGHETLDEKLQNQIDYILTADAELTAFRDLHTTLKAIEQRDVLGDFFRPPFYFWKQRFEKDTKQQLALKCREIASTRKIGFQDQLVLYGLLMRLQGTSEEERAALHAALSVEESILSLDDDLLHDLIIILFAEGQFAAVRKYTLQALERKSTPAVRRELYCDLYFHGIYNSIAPAVFQNTFGNTEQDVLQEALKLCGGFLGADSPHLRHYRAIIACTEKKLDEAVALMVSAGSKKGYFTQFFRAGFNVKTPDEMRAFAEGVTAGSDHLRMGLRHEGTEGCTLVSCNYGYYSMYFRNFAESFSIQNPKGVLHLHAIDFPVDEDVLDKLEAEFDIRINYTEDATDLGALSPDVLQGYCAGARYMYLPEYLNVYNRILVTDIDGILKLSHGDVWHGREDKVLLSTVILNQARKANFVFWSNIGAGATGIPATEEGRMFAKIFSGYLRQRYRECRELGERFFFSDQVGLLLTLMFVGFDGPFLKMPQLFEQSGSSQAVNRGRAKKEAQSKLLETMREGK